MKKPMVKDETQLHKIHKQSTLCKMVQVFLQSQATVTGSSSLLQNPDLPVATLQEKQHENHHPETWQYIRKLLLILYQSSL